MASFTAQKQQLLVAAVIVAAGLGTLLVAISIPLPMTSSAVGPRAAPYGIGAVLLACGVLLLLEALRGGWPCEADDSRPDIWPMLILGAGMIANVALIKTTGFIIATTVMFVFSARAFGARSWWFSALIGFGLALATYYGFARLLDLRIGGGWIEDYL